MAPINDGGSAFPFHRNGRENDGLSTRDYFAAMFASSLPIDIIDRIAARGLPGIDDVSDDPDTIDEFVVPRAEVARRIAVSAYFLADAMIAERERRS